MMMMKFIQGLKTLRPFLREKRQVPRTMEQTLLFHGYNGKRYVTYVDGHRMLSVYVADSTDKKSLAHMIHVDTIDAILKLEKEYKKEFWSFDITRENMTFTLFESDRKTIQQETCFAWFTEGKYPDVANVLPTRAFSIFFVEGKKLFDAIHKVSDIVTFSYDDKTFDITQTMSHEIDGETIHYGIQPEAQAMIRYKKSIDSMFHATEETLPFQATFNAHYIKDMLAVLGKGYVRVELYLETIENVYKKKPTMETWYKMIMRSGDGSFALTMPLVRR